MPAGIFLVQNDGLVELSESPYDSEDVLQGLLARYPSLMAGDQFDAERPRRWLLVKRELGIPDAEGQAGRWSVDHLFLDQDAVPTLVEVKRSSDTRIRREVVGQMLDYAANAVAYWPAERLQAEFEAGVSASNKDPGQALQDFLGGEMEADQFWARARTNLQAGRLRLVFVADQIPPELRRIIEFLNQQMDPTEVLGVEIRQFAGQGIVSLVPRVIGQTAEAERRKGSTVSTKQWDEASVFEILGSRADPNEAAVARRILEWASGQGLRIWWGKGATEGSFYPMFDHDGRSQYTIAVRTGTKAGYIQLQLPLMVAPFDTQAKRADLIARLRAEIGWAVPDGAKYEGLRLSELARPEKLSALFRVLDWIVAQTRAG